MKLKVKIGISLSMVYRIGKHAIYKVLPYLVIHQCKPCTKMSLAKKLTLGFYVMGGVDVPVGVHWERDTQCYVVYIVDSCCLHCYKQQPSVITVVCIFTCRIGCESQ